MGLREKRKQKTDLSTSDQSIEWLKREFDLFQGFEIDVIFLIILKYINDFVARKYGDIYEIYGDIRDIREVIELQKRCENSNYVVQCELIEFNWMI